MLFASFDFIYFFLIFFTVYWLVFNKNVKLQNIFLLLSGYVFYGWADWRFLFYLIATSALNFYLGIHIQKAQAEKRKKWLVYAGLVQGIGGLVFFKYFNFFIISFNSTLHLLGFNANLNTLTLLVPLGISFFTFRMISYVLDVNNGKIKACTNWVIFFTYVSFFPCVLSGPIDRARNLIPQLEKKRRFSYDAAISGARQILWGLFKKVVIADSMVSTVDGIFNTYKQCNTITLIMGAVFFSIQLYADFSGYSDMAIGVARLIGFEVSKNFDFPYFSKNIAEFWRKWHISLTSWLTDYVFAPLSIALRDYGKFGLALAVIVNFVICGLWHGANWTYVFWGFLNGCYFIPLVLTGKMNTKKKANPNKVLPTPKEFISIVCTFSLVTITLIFFKSNSIAGAWGYLRGIFRFNFQDPFRFLLANSKIVILAALFFLTECWLSFSVKPFAVYRPVKYIFYVFIGLLILISFGQSAAFIYFQF